MRRRDRHPMPEEVRRDLAAMDAALAGAVPDGDLAALAVTIRDERPRPDTGVVARLDARAEDGFARPARVRAARRPSLPALGVAGTLALALVAGTVVLSGGNEDRGGQVALDAAPPVTQSRTSPAVASESVDGAGAPAVAAPAPPVAPGRSVERGAQLRLATTPQRLDEVAGDVVRIVDVLGGYVAGSAVESRATAGSATFDLRVPAPQLQTALARLSKLASVRSRSETSLDVTGQVDAARNRVNALQAERRGVLRQLAAASTPAQTAAARARLRLVDARLDRAEAARASLQRRTAYSTIALEVATERPSAGGAVGGGSWTPGDALRDALGVLSVALGAALVAFAVLLPLALLAAAGWGVWSLARARLRRRALITH